MQVETLRRERNASEARFADLTKSMESLKLQTAAGGREVDRKRICLLILFYYLMLYYKYHVPLLPLPLYSPQDQEHHATVSRLEGEIARQEGEIARAEKARREAESMVVELRERAVMEDGKWTLVS